MKKLAIILSALALAIGCSDAEQEQREVVAVPDGGTVGGTGGSTGGNGSTGGGTTTDADCALEYGLVNCIDGGHLRMTLFENGVDDRVNETFVTERGFGVCGKSPTAEAPIDERVVLAREGACFAYRGSVREPFVERAVDAGPINVFSNEQVAALVLNGTCYAPENPVSDFFFEGERLNIDVTGGDDVGPYVGDALWPTAPEVSAVEVRSDRGFTIAWTPAPSADVTSVEIEVSDAQGTTTKIRCAVRDGDSVNVADEVAAMLPEEIATVDLSVTHETVQELVGSEPTLQLVTGGTTQVVSNP